MEQRKDAGPGMGGIERGKVLLRAGASRIVRELPGRSQITVLRALRYLDSDPEGGPGGLATQRSAQFPRP